MLHGRQLYSRNKTAVLNFFSAVWTGSHLTNSIHASLHRLQADERESFVSQNNYHIWIRRCVRKNVCMRKKGSFKWLVFKKIESLSWIYYFPPYLPGANVKPKQNILVCYFVCSSNPRLAYSYITFIIYRFIQVDLLSSRYVKVIAVVI